MRQELLEEFGDEERAKVLSDAAEAVRIYYEELVRRWKEEIDTLLVYTGLFSAILTAFNVQSYQLLQPAPTDPAVAVLKQISAQLSSFSISPPIVDSTLIIGLNTDPQDAFRAPSSAVWINTLWFWFSGLVTSLASASIALLVKQWLHEATVGLSGKSHDTARLRQHRLNGLLRWRVGSIILALPVLLQIALVLFLVGMVVLLWTLHNVVAAVTSFLVGSFFTCFIVVTLMPIFKWDCCYRSPQAFIIYSVVRFGYNTAKQMVCRLFRTARDIEIRLAGMVNPGSFFYRNAARIRYMVDDIPTWHGRDQLSINHHTGQLDRSIATTVYTTTLSPEFLDRIHIILPDLPRDQLNPIIQDLWSTC
ncbi:hypothetical protein C8Q74DRAFT_568815, partial [Fomes fomentarius]